MKSIPAAFQAHLDSGCTTLCTMWKCTLKDGTILGFTDNPVDVPYNSLVYKATSGYTATAAETSSQLNPDNLEVEGFLQSPSITDADIQSGRWDHAAIEIFEVNYMDPAAGRHIIRTGTLGELKGRRSEFTAELRGMMQAYSRTIVNLTTKECRTDLGSSLCKVNVAPFTFAATVTAVVDNRTITAPALTQAEHYFTAGKATFTSGANNGLSMEVKYSNVGTIELHEEMPFTIAVNDTMSVVAGCTKRFTEDCKNKFNNVINFRGFPHLPGSDVYRPGGQ